MLHLLGAVHKWCHHLRGRGGGLDTPQKGWRHLVITWWQGGGGDLDTPQKWWRHLWTAPYTKVIICSQVMGKVTPPELPAPHRARTWRPQERDPPSRWFPARCSRTCLNKCDQCIQTSTNTRSSDLTSSFHEILNCSDTIVFHRTTKTSIPTKRNDSL